MFNRCNTYEIAYKRAAAFQLDNGRQSGGLAARQPQLDITKPGRMQDRADLLLRRDRAYWPCLGT